MPPAAAPAADATPNRREQRRLEFAAVGGVLLLALMLRAIVPDGRVVEHYDEGVYASNLYAGSTGYAYPDRHLYAPPLWPAVIETAILAFGPAAACWPGIAAGVLLTLSVYRIGRDWFDVATGLTAGTLVAVDAVLTLYSRTALVDVPMTLLLAASLWAGHRGVAREDARWLAAAGVAAGLAWSTKYNGWLAVAIFASAFAVWRVAERWRLRRSDAAAKPAYDARWSYRLASALPVGIVGAIAVAVWLPSMLSLPRGYAEVRANHARYFVGLEGWPDAAWQQLSALDVLGVNLIAMLPLAATAFWLAGRGDRFTRLPGRIAVLVVTGLVIVADLPASLVVLLVSQLAGAHLLWRILTGDLATPAARFGGWLLLAWFHSLHLAIPFYTPYPRLTVAVTPAVCLVLAASLQRLARPDRRFRLVRRELAIAAGAIAVVAVGSVAFGLVESQGDLSYTGELPSGPTLVDDRSTVRDAAGVFLAALRDEPLDGRRGFGLYVLGEPSLFFHLSAMADASDVPVVVQPAGNLQVFDAGNTDGQLQAFVAIGPHAVDTFGPIDDPRLERVATFSAIPSRLVALNEQRPSALRRTGIRDRLPFVLYRIRRD